ncbi:hypothetical protein ABK040_015318 [Willaertia magna]
MNRKLMQQGDAKTRTLWMGDLEDFMDEDYVKKLFGNDIRSSITSIKIIRDRSSGKSQGYGFLEFSTIEIAKAVLDTYTGKPIPSLPNKIYRLNWASHGSGKAAGTTTSSSTGTTIGTKETTVSIFVGDLAPDVTDYMLEQTFKNKFQSVRGAKVVMDQRTGISKGYGFVKFADEEEMLRAMNEMQGVYISSRPVKISHAANNFKGIWANNPASSVPNMSAAMGMNPMLQNMPIQQQQMVDDNQPSTTIITTDPLEQENTTVYVGNLAPNTDEKKLREYFQQYGPITSIKIPTNSSNCGFINFTRPEHAERAILEMRGVEINGNRVRVSWGRAQHNKTTQLDEETLKQKQYQAALAAYQFQQLQYKIIHERKVKEEEEKKKQEFNYRFIKPFNVEEENEHFVNDLMTDDYY